MPPKKTPYTKKAAKAMVGEDPGQNDLQGLVSKAVEDFLPGAIARALPDALASAAVKLKPGPATATQGADKSGADIITESEVIEGENKSKVCSVALPPDLHLSKDMKAKIEGCKFMKFGKLLYRDSHNEKKLTLKLASSGKSFVVDPNENSVYIKYIDQWDKAFTIFSYRYLIAHPEEANELLMYGRLIKDMANRGFYWYQYDEQFRRLKELDPKSKPWGVIEPTLWALYATPRNDYNHQINRLPQNSRGGFADHRGNGLDLEQEENPSSPSRYETKNTEGFDDENDSYQYDEMGQEEKVCFRFNKGQFCKFAQNCKFAHKCNACGSYDHGEIDCQD